MTGWDGRPTDDDFTPWDPDDAATDRGGRADDPSADDPTVDTLPPNDRTAAPPATSEDPAPATAAPGSTDPVDLTAPATTPAPATAEPGAAPAVFIDSSAIVALVDQDDSSHGAAVAAYRELVGMGYRLFTSNYVIAETYDLLRTGVGHAVARQWLRDSTLAVYHADEQDERRARRTVLRGRGAAGMTFTDAVSLVVMERFGVADAFAVDPDFLSGND